MSPVFKPALSLFWRNYPKPNYCETLVRSQTEKGVEGEWWVGGGGRVKDVKVVSGGRIVGCCGERSVM